MLVNTTGKGDKVTGNKKTTGNMEDTYVSNYGAGTNYSKPYFVDEQEPPHRQQ
jgi:hypothetical protein